MHRQVREDFLFVFAMRVKVWKKECAKHFSLDNKIEKRTGCSHDGRLRVSGRARAAREAAAQREEIKQNIQYNLICEHNFDAVFAIIERALSLCLPLLHSWP